MGLVVLFRASMVQHWPEDNVVMEGWLLKKHAKPKSGIFGLQWGKRHLRLDAHRGTLACSKSVGGDPNTILPLCDITVVKELEGGDFDWMDGCFQITCPPQQLILRASGNEERDAWMRALRINIAEWHSSKKLQESAHKSCVPAAVADFSPP